MKIKIKDISGIKLLPRNTKLFPECCYILRSESVGKNMYFVTKRDIVRAHKMINKHLCPVMDVIDYLFTPHGWILVVCIKPSVEILESIPKKSNKSKKIKRAIRKQDISMIVSEFLRYAISGMARIINRYNRRKGTLVKGNFERYIFQSIETAELLMEKMKREQLKLCCQRKRYRPSLKWYDKDGELRADGCIFLCTKNRESYIYRGTALEECVMIIDHAYDVLHKFINRTFDTYFYPNTTNKPILSSLKI